MSAPDRWQRLRAHTGARVALERTGNSLPTHRILEFRLAHARARDAVHSSFDPIAIAANLQRFQTIVLETQAEDRQTYVTRPDLGRRLSQASRQTLVRGNFDAALVIADGLSPTGIHAHGPALATAILESLSELRWSPTCVVAGGRVAVGDEIADLLGAEIVVVIIGERPGLSAPDSLGLYLTHRPRPGYTTDADRNCISNIRPQGLQIADSAKRLAWLVRAARDLRLSGTGLKEAAPQTSTPVPIPSSATNTNLR